MRTAQACLTYLGFDPKGVDGIMGNGTRAALRAFQASRGLPPTAMLDTNTVHRLLGAANV